MKIRINNLRKSYFFEYSQLEIIKGLSFNLEEPGICAILGQSGSGKTTLLSLLSGMDKADSGDIYYGDTHFSHLDEKQKTIFRAKYLSIVFQQFHLVPYLSALENVILPLEILGEFNQKEILEKAHAALSSVGLSHRMEHFPKYLSGGECQRVAIARAFVTKPSILLADEPSGNLDQKTGEEVMQFLFKLVRENKTTMLLVTHNQELANACDKRYELKNGIFV